MTNRSTNGSRIESSLRWIRARRTLLAMNTGPVATVAAAAAGSATLLLLWLLAAPVNAVIASVLLCASIAGAMAAAAVRMRLDLELARQRQKERASRDGTTGVDTRRRFLAHAKREMVRAGRYGHPMSVLWVEIDRFDAVRSAQGELNAERVLRVAVGLIRDMVRLPDMVGRIRQPIDAASRRVDGRLIKVSTSVGVAALDARHSTLASLLADVESALRQAQQAGGNVVRTAALRSQPKTGVRGEVEDIHPSAPGPLQLPFQPSTPDSKPNYKRSGEA